MPKFRHNPGKEKGREDKVQERGNMVFVRHKGLDGVNDALRRLRKKLEAEGTMDDYRKASFYVKPSKRKREKRYENIKQAKANARIQRNRQKTFKSGW